MDQKTGPQFDICLTESGDYYVRNGRAISEIIRNVRDGHYCTILGPPHCQKSLLLQDVQAHLEATGDEACVLVNLQDIDLGTDEEFIPGFARILGTRLQEQIGITSPSPLNKVQDERSLQHFLQDYVKVLKRDLVLLLDHLERVRLGPLRALLQVLRAIYVERSPDAPYRLGVVTVSSLSTAALALGPFSPFNIARVTLVQDLTSAESKELVNCILDQKGTGITLAGRQHCIQATGGDRYLIPRLCDYCADLAGQQQRKQITKREVEQAIEWFVDTRAARYPPLREIIRAIEADPVILMDVLKILEKNQVPKHELKLNLEAEIDGLQLTGAVRVESTKEQQIYLIRNEIYERYLKQHFHPDRVVRILSMGGQWNEAIGYLERVVAASPAYRSSLLGTVVDSIYAAQDETEIRTYLGRSLSRAFAIPRTRIYLVNDERSHLALFDQAGFEGTAMTEVLLEDKAQPEVKAYFSPDYLVYETSSGEQVLLVPLRRDEQETLGVIAVHEFEADPQGDDFLEFLAFLKQVGRAIGNVMDRERQLRQLRLLHETGKEITSSLDLKHVLQTTVVGAIVAVRAAQKGSLFLWDEKRERLVIRSHQGFQEDIVDVLQLRNEEGYAGWAYANRQAVRLGNVSRDPRTKYVDHPDVLQQKSAICVPLEAWGRVIGVLCLDNVTAYDAFQQSDLELLSTFGAQAAIAIHNAQLYTELYELGIHINRRELSPREIFRQVAQSITRVSDAKAADLLLLRDTDYPELSVSQKPLLCVSEGLGDDFDEEIRPRPDGLTFRVLKARKPLAVSRPDEQPGINPLSMRRGIQAYLCLPMMVHESIVGVLFVHYDNPHVFSENEIEMLSLFGNQAALAIENAQQRDMLALTDSVVWMGIGFSGMAHRITQKASAIRNVVWGLRHSLGDKPELLKRLDRIDEYAQAVIEIPSQALLPFHDQVEQLDLNAALRHEIPRWCSPESDIIVDLSRLTQVDTPVCIDPQRLATVLEILTTNAVRATSRSSEKKLVVASEIRGQRVVAEITNIGSEIPEDIRERVLKEPIPKAQGGEGTGVGLLIARSIVRRYDGDIELVRTGPEGTTFSLWLPLLLHDG